MIELQNELYIINYIGFLTILILQIQNLQKNGTW